MYDIWERCIQEWELFTEWELEEVDWKMNVRMMLEPLYICMGTVYGMGTGRSVLENECMVYRNAVCMVTVDDGLGMG